MPPEQIFLLHALYTLRKLEEQGVYIEFRRISAHSDIHGNEIADQRAKQAAVSEPLATQNDRFVVLATAV